MGSSARKSKMTETAEKYQTIQAKRWTKVLVERHETEAEWKESRKTGITESAIQTIVDEVIAARGDRSALGLRISTISNFASPNAGGNVAGRFYDQAFHSAAATTIGGVANRIWLSPFYTSQPLTVDQIGIAVTTAIAAALGKCLIYSSDANGWPDALVFSGTPDLDFSTTGYKAHATSFTFDSGRQYWLGVWTSSTATIRSINVASLVNLGLTSNTSSVYANSLIRSVPYGAAPNPWVFNLSELTTATYSPIALGKL
jgi:hypothetical protein